MAEQEFFFHAAVRLLFFCLGPGNSEKRKVRNMDGYEQYRVSGMDERKERAKVQEVKNHEEKSIAEKPP